MTSAYEAVEAAVLDVVNVSSLYVVARDSRLFAPWWVSRSGAASVAGPCALGLYLSSIFDEYDVGAEADNPNFNGGGLHDTISPPLDVMSCVGRIVTFSMT